MEKMIEKCSNLSDKRQQAQPDEGGVQNSSSCITKDVIENLFTEAGISMVDYEYLIPTKDQRANHPPIEYITVYKQQVNKGLRFPILNLVTKVCSLIGISPSQLVPEAYCLIKGFISNAKTYHVPTSALYFFSLFNVGPAPMLGFFDFVPRMEKKFLNEKHSLGNWETEFFFLRHRDTHESWGYLSKWKEICMEPPFGLGLIMPEDESNLLGDILVHMSHQLGNLVHNEGGIKLEMPSHPSSSSKIPFTFLSPTRDMNSPSGAPTTPATQIAHPSRDKELPSINEARPTSTTALLAISKILESAYVPRQIFENIEKERDKLVAELVLEKSRVQQLENKLIGEKERNHQESQMILVRHKKKEKVILNTVSF